MNPTRNNACSRCIFALILKKIFTLAVVSIIAVGCASQSVSTMPNLVWPEPAEQPRFEFVDILKDDSEVMEMMMRLNPDRAKVYEQYLN